MKKSVLVLFLSLSLSFQAQINLTSNLKLCMPFNGNANDISGNGNNGLVNGATLTTDRFGNAGKAYYFNGASNISINSFLSLAPTNELTISMWAKSNVTTSNCLFEILNDTPHDRCVGCAQYSWTSGTMMIFDYGSIYSPGGRMTATGIPADLANWHHYAYVLSQSGNLKAMYLDGVLKISSGYSLSCVNKGKPFYVGCQTDSTGGSLYWNGSIDDICAYNRALTSAEISALYAGTGVCFTTSVDELTGFEKAMVYPTVSESGIYKISPGNSANVRFDVYSIEGKLLYSFTENDKQIDISDAAKGIYILTVSENGSCRTQKLVKN